MVTWAVGEPSSRSTALTRSGGVVQQFGRPHPMGDQDGVRGQFVQHRCGDVAGEMVQQPVAEIVEFLKALPEEGIGDLPHPCAHILLDARHGAFRTEPALDGAAVSARASRDPLRNSRKAFSTSRCSPSPPGPRRGSGRRGCGASGRAHRRRGEFVGGICGDHRLDRQAGLVEEGRADREAGVEHPPLKAERPPIAFRRLRRFVRRGDFGDDHGDGLEGFGFVFRVEARQGILHDEHAHDAAGAQQGHAQKELTISSPVSGR